MFNTAMELFHFYKCTAIRFNYRFYFYGILIITVNNSFQIFLFVDPLHWLRFATMRWTSVIYFLDKIGNFLFKFMFRQYFKLTSYSFWTILFRSFGNWNSIHYEFSHTELHLQSARNINWTVMEGQYIMVWHLVYFDICC